MLNEIKSFDSIIGAGYLKQFSEKEEKVFRAITVEATPEEDVYETVNTQEIRPEVVEEKKIILAKDIGTDINYKHQIVWKNAIGFGFLHCLAVYGLYLYITRAKRNTIWWTIFLALWAGEGVTIGAHRLYSHKSFKASPLLKAILLVLQTVAGQNCMYVWVRDHRQHHRYSDTDADPHNAMRGFFFSHIGWLMHRKHPMVIKMGKTVDVSDLEADWMVMFQKKHYKPLYYALALFIPVLIPIYYWGEDTLTSYMVCYFFRYVVALNVTWLVNSAAHLYGTRPYDKGLLPVESWFVSLLTNGEGWHNYHHAFPWDYKCSEYGMHFNLTAKIIEFCAKIGLASDLKFASESIVESRIKRVGDGTHHQLGNEEAKAAVTTAFGTYMHPLNPSYNSTTSPRDIKWSTKGLPLIPDDLSPEEKQLNSIPTTAEIRRRLVGYGKL